MGFLVNDFCFNSFVFLFAWFFDMIIVLTFHQLFTIAFSFYLFYGTIMHFVSNSNLIVRMLACKAHQIMEIQFIFICPRTH